MRKGSLHNIHFYRIHVLCVPANARIHAGNPIYFSGKYLIIWECCDRAGICRMDFPSFRKYRSMSYVSFPRIKYSEKYMKAANLELFFFSLARDRDHQLFMFSQRAN